MGSGIGVLFAACFPDSIARLICLDLLHFSPQPVKKHAKLAAKSIMMNVKMNDILADGDKRVPEYEWVDAVGRAFMANYIVHGEGGISKESVELLMERGLKKIEGKENRYTWAADLRLRVTSPFNIVLEQVRAKTETYRAKQYLALHFRFTFHVCFT